MPARWAVLLAALFAIIALAASGPRGVRTAHACAFDDLPVTYEPLTYVQDYGYIMELAGYDLLFPGDNEFGRPALVQGPRNARTTANGYIPPVLLKAIAYTESDWGMAASTVPYGGTGDVLAGADCGYGIMQVTSGMTVPLGDAGAANPVQTLIATHYAYNIARGAAILANKWNEGAVLRPIVATGDPHVLEDWYYALWGYNGFALVNHPLSERFTNPARPAYSCNPTDSFGHDRSQYPYQELVYGCAMHPPVRATGPLWTPQPLGLPNLFDPAVAAALNLANYVYPYSKMDLYSPNAPAPAPSLTPIDPAAPTLAATVVDGPARLRAGPSTQTDILGTVDTGALLTLTGRNADSTWAQVRTGGGSAWMLASLLSIQGSLATLPDDTSASPSPAPTPAPTLAATVVDGPARLRAGPSTQTDILGTVDTGALLTLTGRNADSTWAQVRTGGGSAWMLASLLSIQGSLATLPDDTSASPSPAPTPAPTTSSTNPFSGGIPVGTTVFTVDGSAPPSLARRGQLMGTPSVLFEVRPVDVTIATSQAMPDATAVATIRNTGTGIGVWMALSNQKWLTPLPIAGVAIAADVACKSETVFCDRQVAVRLRVNGSALKPGENLAQLRFFNPLFPGQVTTVPVRIFTGPVVKTAPLARVLVAGCNPVGVASPDGTAIEALAALVQPVDAITAIWRLPNAQSAWELYFPGQPAASSLKTVNSNDALYLCTKAPATLTQEVALAPAARITPLLPGCTFVGVGGDMPVSAFAASVQPPTAVTTVWRFDPGSGGWLLFLPTSPFVSTLTSVVRADGVFICVSAAAILPNTSLAPPN